MFMIRPSMGNLLIVFLAQSSFMYLSGYDFETGLFCCTNICHCQILNSYQKAITVQYCTSKAVSITDMFDIPFGDIGVIVNTITSQMTIMSNSYSSIKKKLCLQGVNL